MVPQCRPSQHYLRRARPLFYPPPPSSLFLPPHGDGCRSISIAFQSSLIRPIGPCIATISRHPSGRDKCPSFPTLSIAFHSLPPLLSTTRPTRHTHVHHVVFCVELLTSQSGFDNTFALHKDSLLFPYFSSSLHIKTTFRQGKPSFPSIFLRRTSSSFIPHLLSHAVHSLTAIQFHSCSFLRRP